MSPTQLPTAGVLVTEARLHAWTLEVVTSMGTPSDIAADVADALVAADMRGVATHGTFRLPVYVSVSRAGALDVEARPSRAGGTDVLTLWDGQNGWGPHGGRVMMDDAIERAREFGMAASVARHASHFGIAGWYSMRAAARNVIGIVMTNTSPLVAPTGGRTRTLGTNPISMAAPAGRAGTFLLDMATSAVTWGHVIAADRHGWALAPRIAVDVEGTPTTEPHQVLVDGALLGLGGPVDSGGHKGYGLAVMVDILTGVLAGAAFGSGVIPMSHKSADPSNLGQLFLAIDPRAMGDDGFEDRMASLLEELRSAPPAAHGHAPVLVHGDPESEREAIQRMDGIRISRPDHDSLVGLGERLSIPFPATIPFGPDAS